MPRDIAAPNRGRDVVLVPSVWAVETEARRAVKELEHGAIGVRNAVSEKGRLQAVVFTKDMSQLCVV